MSDLDMYSVRKKREIDPNAPPRPTLLGHEKVIKDVNTTIQALESQVRALSQRIGTLESRLGVQRDHINLLNQHIQYMSRRNS